MRGKVIKESGYYMYNVDLNNKTILITGVAGFIGSYLTKGLFSTFDGIKVVGIDNVNDYYDVRLKKERLKEIKKEKNFKFIKGSIADKELILSIFDEYKPQVVVNLGAQAGVRYSIVNPDAYIESNIIGFLIYWRDAVTILEASTLCIKFLCIWKQ